MYLLEAIPLRLLGAKWRRVCILLLVATLGVAAAGCDVGADPSESVGQRLFRQQGCSNCHSTGDRSGAGPPLGGIAGVAAERQPGMSAEEYLRESIVDPDAHIVDGYRRGIMPRDYGRRLSDSDIEALIEYLKGL